MNTIQHTEDPFVYCECSKCDPDQYRFESHEEYMKAVDRSSETENK